MFSLNGYAPDGHLYLQIIDKHVAPAINLLSMEYFNNFDETCQKMIALTLSQILKRQSDYYIDRGLSISHDA